MADAKVEEAASAIEMVAQDQTEGYCDPVTGVCVWPGAAQAESEAEVDDSEEPSPTE